MNSKAQVNSPFELLVAIIIMGFVVIIGSQMIANANDQVCLATIDKEITEFKLKLEDTASFRTSNKFEFRPNETSCYNENKSIVKIEKYSDSKKCGTVCGRATDSCFVFTFQASDIANGLIQKCLNLPVYTSFVTGSDCPTDEADLSGFDPINPTAAGQRISSGTYILRNVAAAGKTYPVICTYRRI